mgnify:CR=1 FL=1
MKILASRNDERPTAEEIRNAGVGFYNTISFKPVTDEINKVLGRKDIRVDYDYRVDKYQGYLYLNASSDVFTETKPSLLKNIIKEYSITSDIRSNLRPSNAEYYRGLADPEYEVSIIIYLEVLFNNGDEQRIPVFLATYTSGASKWKFIEDYEDTPEYENIRK